MNTSFIVREVMPLRAIKRLYVEHVLAETNGNKAKAARLLGMDRRTLYRMRGRRQP